jgi:hypothetical protein
MVHKAGHGVSDTVVNDLNGGALGNFLGQDIANQASSIANQLYPQLPEPDPWEAAFQFFAEMGRQASQPGATVLGSAVGSMQAPLDYLNAKKKEKAESDRARMQSTITLGTALKGKDKVTYRPATDVELAKYGSTAGQMGSDGKFYDLSSSGDSSKPNTELSKLYDDFDRATIQAEKNATKFITENPNATVEQIAEAAESDPSAQEAKTLSEQIDTVANAAGFNKEIFSGERDLRKEWNNFKKPFNLIQVAYQKLKASLESGTGAGDMASVFGFMKLLDPGSVVRESEFAAAQNTAGLMDKIILQRDRLDEGELLTPDQRDEFLKLATQFYNLTRDQFGDARLDLGQVVENNPVFNVENIFGSETAPPSWYTSQEIYNSAKSLGMTVDEVWETMTDPERKKWKQENGVL